MSFPEGIFRSYDIRGLIEEITPELANRVGSALVKKTNAKTVVIGRDMRANSPELMQAAIKGVTSQGANVIDIGMCTTSLFNFAVSSRSDVDAGMMITASHNPAEYNGIKMSSGDAMPISGKEMKKLIQEEMLDVENKGSVEMVKVVEDYLKICMSHVDLPDLSGVKVVVDYGNGMGSVTMSPLLERLGIKYVEMYKEPDATFPNHEANPVKDETLADLKKKIVEVEADFGIGLDGDADRIGFVDGSGESVRGDLMLALMSVEVLKNHPEGKIISAPNQSWKVRELVEAAGGKIVEERIGRTHAIKAMHNEEAALGGEVSSHFFFQEFSNLEAVDYAFLLILSLWKKSGQSFADFVAPVREYSSSGEVNTQVEDKDTVMKRVEEAYVNKATKCDKLDGIKCEFDRDWWFILRPSNTEPLLRLTVEATSEELMQEKVREITSLMG
jgi:phosphomannomutase